MYKLFIFGNLVFGKKNADYWYEIILQRKDGSLIFQFAGIKCAFSKMTEFKWK